MATSVKERIKTELEQAKSESKQRAERIGNILKDAAVMTFGELKEGSSELNTLTRKSLSDLLEELQEGDEANTSVDAHSFSSDVDEDVVSEKVALTWKELIVHAITIVRDRKGDWYQQLKDYLRNNASQYDADMTRDYGDRYLKTKSILRKVATWLESKARGQASPAASSDIQPINIEVVDGEVTDAANHQ